MLVGVSGYGHAGKDTIGAILVEDHGFIRASFADALREVAYAVNPIVKAITSTDRNGLPRIVYLRYADLIGGLGYEGAKKLSEVRDFLQRVGTEAGRRVLGEDIWVNTAMNRLEPDKNYVFTDVRFPNEAGAVRDRGGVVWRVSRPGFGPVNGHPSETSLDDYNFDRHIENDSTLDDLRVAVSAWLSQDRAASIVNKMFAPRP